MYTIGMDFGSDSVRALLVDVSNGEQIAESVCLYPRWAQHKYISEKDFKFRQHPLDYLESMEKVLIDVVAECPNAENIMAISVDTTASTPCLVDERLIPLALRTEFSEDPDAMFVLWKDHTAQKESEIINAVCHSSEIDYSRHSGGNYSPECFWSKILHILNTNERVREEAVGALELCDWIPAVLVGCHSSKNLVAGKCVASIKHMWAPEWGGLPKKEFLEEISPLLSGFYESCSYKTAICGSKAGFLSEEWANKLGLSNSVAVGVGNVDCYSGAVGAEISHKTVVLNLGTSSCYMAVMPNEMFADKIVDGVFGQACDSILPGMVGFETGMSAFGDLYAWLKKFIASSFDIVKTAANKNSDDSSFDSTVLDNIIEKAEHLILPYLSQKAEKLEINIDSPIATDHFNGRRTPNPNLELRGVLSGMDVSVKPETIYYMLVEATCFATKVILDFLSDAGVEMSRFIAIGGISYKSPFVMQMLSDVLQKKIEVSNCKNSAALGAAIHAAVVADIYQDVDSAQKVMCPDISVVYEPNLERSELLLSRFEKYLQNVSHAEMQ